MGASPHLELLVICNLEVAFEKSGLEQLCLNEISQLQGYYRYVDSYSFLY